MTALEKVKAWLETWERFSELREFQVDYTDQIPDNGGLFPSGLTEVNRKSDILGNVTIENQLNFAIYYVFEKAGGDDIGAENNQEWVAAFQNWVQEQSARGLAPAFGDVPNREIITAQNGVLYDASAEGIGIYMVQLSIRYLKRYE